MYYFYVLRKVANLKEFYTGYSSDLRKRVEAHNRGQETATRGRRWELVYYEAYINERVAKEREHKIKNNGRMRTLLMDRIKLQFESD